jgi:serine/threonine protein kinase
MQLASGTCLGPYEILAPVGAGGMGEVYRARDSKLNREVAIKVLPAAFANDSDRMARFEREAQVLASLNHPHIAAIYGLEESDGMRALVMELVEGPTLGEQIGRRAMTLEETLPIAKQIAEALEYAHEKGIIHRDLKPANVKLTADGNVKVLDFGLAKALEAPAPAVGNPSISPTLTIEGTRAGMILGTAAYMSPEQASGKPADRRADIWSFGAVLYEMLTGKKPFEGESVSDTLANVLKLDPNWDALPAATPAAIRRLLSRCLTKDRKQRLQAIGEARIALENPAKPETTAPSRSWLVIAVAMIILTSAFGWIAWRATWPVDHPLMKFSSELAPGPNGTSRLDDTILAASQPGTWLALSPDGMRLALEVRDADGKFRLATRRLDENRFTSLPGTENPTSPFFSPDGQWIAFFGDGKLRKMPVHGGAPVVLCGAENSPSGSWGDDDNIIASLNREGGLARIPSAGGEPVRITELKQGELMHRWPQLLPGSEAVLFTAYTGGGPEDASIEILSFKTHRRKTLIRGGVMGRYLMASDGHAYLIYLHQDTLLAAAFDAGRLAIKGTALPILDDVGTFNIRGPGDFDVSRTGAFVYVSGRSEPERSIFWLDHTGKTEPLHPAPGFYNGMRFSPDGKRLVFAMGDDYGLEDLWVQDLERNALVRLTSLPGASHSPVWSVDGIHILFSLANTLNAGIYRIRSDGAGVPQQLADGTLIYPTSFSPDGKRLALLRGGNPFSATEVLTAQLEGASDHPLLGKTDIFLRARGFPMPAFSPNGHWVVYASQETGRSEIYVQPFPGPGAKVPVSTSGGVFPLWSANGHELFFLGLDRRIMVADYTAQGDSFSPGKPRVWSQQQIVLKFGGGPFQPYALAPDGKRFAVMLYPDGSTERQNPLHLTLLLNFGDEVRGRVAIGK